MLTRLNVVGPEDMSEAGRRPRRPSGRPSWRKDGAAFRGVLVGKAGRVVWRCAAVSTTRSNALEDARQGGQHWSTSGRSVGFTPDMAWKQEDVVRRILEERRYAAEAAPVRAALRWSEIDVDLPF